MNRSASEFRGRNAKLLGLALTTALAGATLASCTTSAPPAAQSAGKAEAALAKGKHESAVRHAESAVLADPRNAGYRAMLGAAYLDAGRFGSAITAFSDARTLGDRSSATALSLALSLAANGQGQQAMIVLDETRGAIGASDLGLAYSLAGDPQRGVHILTAALRGGENTVKVRQNLAYSFALAGQWRQARLMAAEDVPADQLGARMTEWAAHVHPMAYRERVAALLTVPVTYQDPGQPVQLALSNFPSAEELAAEASAAAPMSLAAMQGGTASPAAPAAQPAALELPPIGDPVDSRLAAHATPEPASMPAGGVQKAGLQKAKVQPASAQAEETGSLWTDTIRFVQESVVQQIFPETSAATKGSAAKARPAAAHAKSNATASRQGAEAKAAATHMVQLGSFLSEASAQRAWSIYVKRYPELKDHQRVITHAKVGGKDYWRVSAAGFSAGAATAMCGQVQKRSGDGCFAYAADHPLPGAVNTTQRFASR